MNIKFLENKVLIFISIILSVVLILLIFVILFRFIENKTIDSLEQQSDTVIDEIETSEVEVMSDDLLKKLDPNPNVKPHTFSQDVLQKLDPNPNVKPHTFSQDVLQKLDPRPSL